MTPTMTMEDRVEAAMKAAEAKRKAAPPSITQRVPVSSWNAFDPAFKEEGATNDEQFARWHRCIERAFNERVDAIFDNRHLDCAKKIWKAGRN